MSDVHPYVRNAVIAAVWTTILVPAAALLFAVASYTVRIGITGEVIIPDVALGPQTQLMLVLALVGGYGFVVWVVVRETFGGDDVDAAVDSAADAVETATEVDDEVQ